MHKIFLVCGITLICVVVQLSWAHIFGSWLTPNFVLIAVVFLNLYRGLRYSLGAAFLGGFFLDSFSGSPDTGNIFSLVLCTFLAAWLKSYIYQPGVAASRALMIFAIVSANVLIQYFLLTTKISISFGEAFRASIFSEIFLTTLVASYTFERLKQCALKLFA